MIIFTRYGCENMVFGGHSFHRRKFAKFPTLVGDFSLCDYFEDLFAFEDYYFAKISKFLSRVTKFFRGGQIARPLYCRRYN